MDEALHSKALRYRRQAIAYFTCSISGHLPQHVAVTKEEDTWICSRCNDIFKTPREEQDAQQAGGNSRDGE